jgi:5-methylcytosine-specific restriction endonuclease McrA
MSIDYKEYHPKWSLISRLIRKRENNCCKFCGIENYTIRKHKKKNSVIVLTVAHLDHRKNNNEFSNLAALCQRCHLKHDIHQHVANRKYGRKHKGKHQLQLM